MKVLSLFDGMSCGRIALDRAGIPVDQYLASEIDKHAIQIAQKNYPATVQLGDVRVVRQMAQCNFFGHVDLLIGGSPCQGFSFAGRQLAFNDPRSALFFEFVWTLAALRAVNPNIKFLLENVKMKKEHLAVITQILGVAPVFINSALVSAQNRQRYYWANWSFGQPQDRGIFLKDILESGEVDRDKSYCIDANYYKGGSLKNYMNKARRQNYLSPCHDKSVAFRSDEKRLMVKEMALTDYSEKLQKRLVRHNIKNVDEKANPLLAESSRMVGGQGNTCVPLTARHLKNVKMIDDKSFTLLSSMHKGAQANGMTLVSKDNMTFRKLTVVECERLQTVPDNYTAGVSNTQRYKMLGNGWTVDVIAHILRSLPREL